MGEYFIAAGTQQKRFQLDNIVAEQMNDEMSQTQFTQPSLNYDTEDCDYWLKFTLDIE